MQVQLTNTNDFPTTGRHNETEEEEEEGRQRTRRNITQVNTQVHARRVWPDAQAQTDATDTTDETDKTSHGKLLTIMSDDKSQGDDLLATSMC